MRNIFNAYLVELILVLLLSACSDPNPAFQQAKKSVWGSLENGCDYDRVSFDDQYVTRYGSDEVKEVLVKMGIPPVQGNESKTKIIGVHSDGDDSFIFNNEKGWSSKFMIDPSGDVLREVERGKLGYRKEVEPGSKLLSGEYKICGGK